MWDGTTAAKRQDNWYLAAGQNIGIRELAEAVEQKVYADNAECVFLIPYSAGNVASYLMEQAQILPESTGRTVF